MIFIFDLWGTLGDKNASFSTALRKHFNLELKGDAYKLFEESLQVKEEHSLEEMAKNFLEEFDLEQTEKNIEFVVAAQKTAVSYSAPFPEMHRILEKLKEHHRVFLLSNATRYETIVIEKWGFNDLFERTFFSCETKKLKPSKEAFKNVLQELDAKECVFIDDNEKNCDAARKLGMQTHLFTSVADFELFLEEILY